MAKVNRRCQTNLVQLSLLFFPSLPSLLLPFFFPPSLPDSLTLLSLSPSFSFPFLSLSYSLPHFPSHSSSLTFLPYFPHLPSPHPPTSLTWISRASYFASPGPGSSLILRWRESSIRWRGMDGGDRLCKKEEDGEKGDGWPKTGWRGYVKGWGRRQRKRVTENGQDSWYVTEDSEGGIGVKGLVLGWREPT